MLAVLAVVTLPFASTVNVGMAVDDPYAPAVTAVLAKVAANVPVPVPVTSPVNVMVWSPVFDPLNVVIPNLVLMVEEVSSPLLVPDVFVITVCLASVT